MERNVTIECGRNIASALLNKLVQLNKDFSFECLSGNQSTTKVKLDDEQITFLEGGFGGSITIIKEPTLEELKPKIFKLLKGCENNELELDWSVDVVVDSNFMDYEYFLHINRIYINHTDEDELWIEDSGSYDEPLTNLKESDQLNVLKEVYNELTTD